MLLVLFGNSNFFSNFLTPFLQENDLIFQLKNLLWWADFSVNALDLFVLACIYNITHIFRRLKETLLQQVYFQNLFPFLITWQNLFLSCGLNQKENTLRIKPHFSLLTFVMKLKKKGPNHLRFTIQKSVFLRNYQRWDYTKKNYKFQV